MTEPAPAAVDPTAAPPLVSADRVSAILYPAFSFGLLFVLWQFGVRAAGVPEYILPVPTEFFAKLWTDRMLISGARARHGQGGRAGLPDGRGGVDPARLLHRVGGSRSSAPSIR